MYEWDHNGKVDLNDGFIQDEIESRHTGAGGSNAGSGAGGGGTGSGGAGSGGCCIFILLIPVLIIFFFAAATNAPGEVYKFIFFLFIAAVLLGTLIN